MSTLTGQTIGKYELLERLGCGGMAEVYKARQSKLDRTVAIKILHGYLAEGEDFLARFEREARAVAILRHPHIVQIHDFDVDGSTYYMVMEFIDGGTLQDQMAELKRNGKYMPIGQVIAILNQIAEALDYAHKKGIIHRDIKPSNILLNESGEAFLTDFGIARMVSTTQFTSTGALIGTPTYMSPEQSKGEELTAASDIYSLGVILFELLTGQAPFSADTPLAVIQKHVSQPLPRPASLRTGLPSKVEEVVARSLAKEPDQRFQNAIDMAHALEQSLTTQEITILDLGRIENKTTFTTQPTEMMEQSSFSGKEQLSTVAMSEETLAEISGKPVNKQVSEMEADDLSHQNTGIPNISQKEKEENHEIKDGSPGKLSWLKSRPFVIGVIVVILLTVLTLGLRGLFQDTPCSSIDTCLTLRQELQDHGDIEGALAAMDHATSLVPPEDHREFGWIWCERATLLDQLDRVDEANENRMICDMWNNGG